MLAVHWNLGHPGDWVAASGSNPRKAQLSALMALSAGTPCSRFTGTLVTPGIGWPPRAQTPGKHNCRPSWLRDALSGPAVAASTALATHAAGTAIAVDSPVAEQRRAVAVMPSAAQPLPPAPPWPPMPPVPPSPLIPPWPNTGSPEARLSSLAGLCVIHDVTTPVCRRTELCRHIVSAQLARRKHGCRVWLDCASFTT